MKYVSLFSGIGGFETGLNKLVFSCVFASEIDKHARKAYQTLYGMEPAGDVTKIPASSVPDHDLLVAGFPCQAFSYAGKRKGFEDTRGTLFFEVARIAKEKQPKYILLENVKGLLSHDKGRTLQIILETLSEIGYTVDFTILNSKNFGVPQNRERLFIVGVLDGRTEDVYKIEGNDVLARTKDRINSLIHVKKFNFPFPKGSGTVVLLTDILEENPDQKYYLSDDKTKQLLSQLPPMTNRVQPIVNNKGFLSYRQISTCLDANYFKGLDNHGQRTGILEVRPVLTPDRENKRQNGRRFKEDGEPSFTLTAQDRHGVAVGQYPNYRIRKLTPLECFRLQGFPDSYYFKLKDANISDSQLYKMAGNAVTVNVIEELGKALNQLKGDVSHETEPKYKKLKFFRAKATNQPNTKDQTRSKQANS